MTGIELMPRLVVGYTELGGSKLKNGKGKSKPNFELVPNPCVSVSYFVINPSVRPFLFLVFIQPVQYLVDHLASRQRPVSRVV